VRLFTLKKSGLKGIEFDLQSDEEPKAVLFRRTKADDYIYIASSRDLSDRDFVRVIQPDEIWEYGFKKISKLPAWAKKSQKRYNFKFVYELADSPA
jgi:hypothetical protein